MGFLLPFTAGIVVGLSAVHLLSERVSNDLGFFQKRLREMRLTIETSLPSNDRDSAVIPKENTTRYAQLQRANDSMGPSFIPEFLTKSANKNQQTESWNRGVRSITTLLTGSF
ncbi:hypothetical protein BJ742DRAFT_815891 [Cladochytrium replicatum]|nr:hypothetical protein BJ742DRAFT_815891 [Cladochytrium replicatum]